MIRINCTNCKTLLTIDEAFAGGVCRCQHCGTIQTVPSHLKNAAATQGAQSKLAGNGASKSLYQRKTHTDGSPGSGLDAIAEVIATSSGLSGSGLSSSGPRRSVKRDAYELPPKKNWLMPVLIGAGALILILAGAVIYLATRTPSTPAVSNSTPAPSTDDAQPTELPHPKLEFHPEVRGAPARTGEASFLGVSIKESSVVYLLDSSGATRSTFDPMVQACLRSLDTLKPNQKFAVIFWHSDTDEAYPANGMSPATPQNVAAAKEKLKDAYASGASDIKPSLKKALAQNPAVIFIASGKWLQDDFAKTVLDARKGSGVKIHCLSLGQSESDDALKKISDTTHGQFRDLSIDELKAGGQ